MYFLLLALPFQAFASASMLPSLARAAELPPCHQQMTHDGQAMSKASPAGDGHAGQHAKGKCGSCAACFVGAAVVPSLNAAIAPAPPSTASIPFRAGHLPSVDPVLPERPPSLLPA